MCGRYSLDPAQSREIREILRQVRQVVRLGEVFPTDPVPVLVKGGGNPSPQVMTWGYPRPQGKSGSIINARSETAGIRPMFQRSLKERRCVLPTTGFYEWGGGEPGKKRKYHFSLPGSDTLYLAGLWKEFAGQARCVILTRAADACMDGIHDRMPVVLPKKDLPTWLEDDVSAPLLLRQPPPGLVHTEA